MEFEDLEYPYRIVYLHPGSVEECCGDMFPIPCKLRQLNDHLVTDKTDWNSHLVPLLTSRPLTIAVEAEREEMIGLNDLLEGAQGLKEL